MNTRNQRWPLPSFYEVPNSSKSCCGEDLRPSHLHKCVAEMPTCTTVSIFLPNFYPKYGSICSMNLSTKWHGSRGVHRVYYFHSDRLNLQNINKKKEIFIKSCTFSAMTVSNEIVICCRLWLVKVGWLQPTSSRDTLHVVWFANGRPQCWI